MCPKILDTKSTTLPCWHCEAPWQVHQAIVGAEGLHHQSYNMITHIYHIWYDSVITIACRNKKAVWYNKECAGMEEQNTNTYCSQDDKNVGRRQTINIRHTFFQIYI